MEAEATQESLEMALALRVETPKKHTEPDFKNSSISFFVCFVLVYCKLILNFKGLLLVLIGPISEHTIIFM